jgi:hypothetical protein
MVTGDSMAYNVAHGLSAWAEATGLAVVDAMGHIGCPIRAGGARYDASGYVIQVAPVCDWWVEGGAARVQAFQPDVVLVVTGANEVYDRTHPSWEGRRAPGDPVFDAFLLDNYRRHADVMGSGGAPVLWAVPPCNRWKPEWVDPAAAEARWASIVTATIPALAASRPVQLVDLLAELCPGGTFAYDLWGMRGVRPDGYHLTDEAAAHLAEHYLAPILLAAR